MVFRDAYGNYWFTNPQAGVEQPDGSWLTFQTSLTIRRPGTTVIASSHTHPNTLPDGTGVTPDFDGDNQSDLPMFVIRADDTVWYFKPNQHRAKLYGKIVNGQLVTKYSRADNLNDDNYDPYQLASQTGMGSGDGTVWVEAGAIALIGSGLLTALILGGGAADSPSIPTYRDFGFGGSGFGQRFCLGNMNPVSGACQVE